MSRVFSMEPEGMTRAWPRVPLMSMKARMTQNQAMASLLTFALMEASAGLGAASAEEFLDFDLIASAFTIHLNPVDGDLSILERIWNWCVFPDTGGAVGRAGLKPGAYMGLATRSFVRASLKVAATGIRFDGPLLLARPSFHWTSFHGLRVARGPWDSCLYNKT